MTTCCQGTVSPVGKVCGDCPHRPYKPPESLDILEPKDIAKRARDLNLHGDEPWPGYSGGKLLPPPKDDGIVEGYGCIDPPIVFCDFEHELLNNIAGTIGLTYSELTGEWPFVRP